MLSWWWSNVQHYGQWSMTYTTRFICQQQVKICIGRFQDNGTHIGAEAKLQIVLNGDYLVALQSTVGPEMYSCQWGWIFKVHSKLLVVECQFLVWSPFDCKNQHFLKHFFFRDKALEIFLSSFVFIYFFVTVSN